MKKNLLIIAQAVDKNDSDLSFFCEWLEEFGSQLDNVYVIANKVGEYDLSKNITVVSLGKENGISKIGRLFNFWKYLFKFLPQSQSVLAHMCPEYVIYGSFLARLFGKKVGLWYLHKSMTWKLKLSSLLVNHIFTAHADGLPIKSTKVVVTGHGINLSLFNFVKKENQDIFRLLTVGRIAESKNLLFLAKFAIILQKKLGKQVKFIVVGESYLKSDYVYLEKIKKYLTDQKAENIVNFIGKVDHKNIAQYYSQADLFLNAGRTGGIDKVVLEAMAGKIPVVTSNQAFKKMLPDNCLFADENMEELLEKSLNYKNINVNLLYEIVSKNHSLKNTISKIILKLLP